MYFLVFIFAFVMFNLIILAHEWGHYITAIKFGVRVNEFALGMGPQIFKIKKNDTVYSIRAFPIGGFCAMEGEEKTSDDKKHSFREKSAWKRMIIISAGAIMNIIVGFFLSVFVTSFQKDIFSTRISSFSKDAVSNSSNGLRVNDEIISINGYKTHIDQDIIVAISLSSGSNLKIDVIRNGEFVRLENVSFNTREVNGKKVADLDFSLCRKEKNFINTMIYSSTNVGSTVRTTWMGLIGLIRGKFTIKDLAGPVGLASCVGTITDEHLKNDNKNIFPAMMNIVSFMMMISISLGVFNLIPFPALDGGRILLLIPELVAKKKVSEKMEEVFNTIGFSFLMILAIIVTCSDVLKIIKGA